MVTHKLSDIIAAGYTEVGECTQSLLVGSMTRLQAHCAFRLTDGRWHMFRLTDPVAAARSALAAGQPFLPLSKRADRVAHVE